MPAETVSSPSRGDLHPPAGPDPGCNIPAAVSAFATDGKLLRRPVQLGEFTLAKTAAARARKPLKAGDDVLPDAEGRDLHKPAPKGAAMGPAAGDPAFPNLCTIDTFRVADENPRKIRPKDAIEALAANIAANGVLSPLICYEDVDGKLAVTCGGTRLLAARKAGVSLLPCRILPREEAVRAGLAEQEGHTPLHPADQAEAYAAELERIDGLGPLVREAAIRTIANRFGRTPRFVEQRLALAALHKPILDALRKDAITVKQAEAWANAPIERQEQVWGGKGAHLDLDPRAIKHLIDKADLADTDRLVKFVGPEAYRAAGGGIRQDLFEVDLPAYERDKGATRYDRTLVQKLAREKLAAAKARVEKEGWGEVEATLASKWSPTGKTCKTAAERAKHKVLITIDTKGKLSYARGLPLPKAEKPDDGKAAGKAEKARAEADRKKAVRDLTADIACQIVARSLTVHSAKALLVADLMASFIDEIRGSATGLVDLNGWGEPIESLGLMSDGAWEARRAQLVVDYRGHKAKLLEVLHGLTPVELDKLLAFVVADAIAMPGWAADELKRGAAANLIALTSFNQVDSNQHLTPEVIAKVNAPLLDKLLGGDGKPETRAPRAKKSTQALS